MPGPTLWPPALWTSVTYGHTPAADTWVCSLWSFPLLHHRLTGPPHCDLAPAALLRHPCTPELSPSGRKGFKNKGRGCAEHRWTGTLTGLLFIYDPQFLSPYSSIFPCSLLSKSPKPLPLPVLFSSSMHPVSPAACLDLKSYS